MKEERVLRDSNAWHELGFLRKGSTRLILWLVGPEVSDNPTEGIELPDGMEVFSQTCYFHLSNCKKDLVMQVRLRKMIPPVATRFVGLRSGCQPASQSIHFCD